MLVTVDVKTAFNSLRWSDMLEALDDAFRVVRYLLRMVDNYLTDSALLYGTQEGQRHMATSAEAAQDSVLGPDLWNAFQEDGDAGRVVFGGVRRRCRGVVAARTINQAQIKLNREM